MTGEPRCAVGVPNVGPFGDPLLLVELATAAEEHGWDGFFVWDHLLYHDQRWDVADPVAVIAAVAARTARIRIGVLVNVLARRRIGEVARESVTVDLLSAGRLVVGAGLGSLEAEFTAFAGPARCAVERGTGDGPRTVPDCHRCADAAAPGAAAADPGLVRWPVAGQGAVQARRPLGRGDAHPCRVRPRPDHAAGRAAGRGAVHPRASHRGRPLRRDPGGTYRRRGARPRRRAGSPVPGGRADLVDRGAGLVARQPAGRDEPGPPGAADADSSPALIPLTTTRPRGRCCGPSGPGCRRCRACSRRPGRRWS